MDDMIISFDFDDVMMDTRNKVDAYVKKYCELGTVDGWKKRVNKYEKECYGSTTLEELLPIIEEFEKDKLIRNELMKMVENAKVKAGDVDLPDLPLLATEEKWNQIKIDHANGKISEEDFKKYNAIHYDLKDQILEETNPVFKDLIPYEEIITVDNLFPNTLNYLSYYLEKYPNCRFAICSHYNVEREKIVKGKLIKECLPNFKFIPVQFYEEEYAPGLIRTRNNKAIAILNAFHLKNLKKVILADDTLFNLQDVRDLGGIGIEIKDDRDNGLTSRNLNPLQIMMVMDAYLIQKGLLKPEDIDKQENIKRTK